MMAHLDMRESTQIDTILSLDAPPTRVTTQPHREGVELTSNKFLGPMFRLLSALRISTCSSSSGLEFGVQLKLLFWDDGTDVHTLPAHTSGQ